MIMKYPTKNFALWALLPFAIILGALMLTGGEPLKNHVPAGMGLPLVGGFVLLAVVGGWWLFRKS